MSSGYLPAESISSLSIKIANLFSIKQRRIFQIIETETAHFTEIEAGAVMNCLTSVSAVSDGETRENQRTDLIERRKT